MSQVNLPIDEGRFDSFIHDRYRGLLHFLRGHTASLQDAEDVAQESVVKLLRYRESKPAADWPRLLYRIALNTANDRFRDIRHHQAVARLVCEDRGATLPGVAPEEFAARQQKLASLREAVLQLPPKCRRVCLLRLALGMSNMQIARRCGISVKMVEKHLAKGLAKLRQRVGDSAADPFK